MLLSVDPGQEVGLVYWTGPLKKFCYPEAAMIVKSSADEWQRRCDDVCEATTMFCDGRDLDTVVIEFPSYMQSHGGQRAARRGDLVKLVYMAGRLHETLRQLVDCPAIITVEVNVWKGQMSKEVVNERVVQTYARRMDKGKAFVTERLRSIGMSENWSHDWDALAIGLWAKGFF